MDVVSLCPLRVGSLLWQPRRGTWVLTAVCKATYGLMPAESPLAQAQEYPNDYEGHWNDDPARSLYAPCDLVPFKPRADVMLVGHAFAPRKEPARSIVARLVVGEVSKAIEVWCDRAWTQDGTLREGPRFVKMPLRYERAAGGPDTGNPVGMRLDARPDAYGSVSVPNLQPPGLLLGTPKDFVETVCFGPIAWGWQPRRDRLGRHGPSWSPAGWSQQPIPEDIDPGFFNAAPRDQQVDQLRPNERIVLDNLHPDHARLATNLPGVQPRAFVERRGAAPQELSLICDTLWIDTDRGVCTLTWRAQVPLEHPMQQGRVLIAMAEPGQRLSWSDVERLAAAPPAERDPEPATPRGQRKGDPLVSTSHVEPAAKRKAPTLPFLGEPDAFSVRSGPSEPSLRMGRPRADTVTGLREDVLPPVPSFPAKSQTRSGIEPAPAGMTLGPAANAPSADASPPWLAHTRSGAQSPFAKAPPGSPFAGAPPPPFTSSGGIPEPKPVPPPLPPPPPPPPPPPSPSVTPPPFAMVQQAPAAPPLTVGQQAAPPPPNLASPSLGPGAGLVTPSGLAPAAGPGGAPVNLGPIATAPSAASVPAMVSAGSVAVAATVGVAAVSNAAAASARAAAQAQAQAQASAPGGAQPAQAAAPRATGTRPREVIDLLWFDPEALPRLRAHAAWKKLLESVKADPSRRKDAKKKDDLGFDDDDEDAAPPPPPNPPGMADRRDVSTVMARGEMIEPDWAHDAIQGAVADDGSFLPPLILTGGELLFPFDELETLKATMAVVSPLVGTDKKLKETVDSVNELLQNKALDNSAGVAEGLTARVKEAFGAQARMLPASYLDTTTERMLLEQRRYQKRTVFGAKWVRAELTSSAGGGGGALPVYLPDDLASRLPMFQRFRAKVVAEAHLSQDQYEASPTALKVVAVARVMPVGLAAFPGARGERRA